MTLLAPKFAEHDQTGVSPNCSPRGQRPRYFLLHTQEGDGNAQSLASYLQNPNSQVSYHYTVDNGVTVIDVVDTDLAAWAVLDANSYSINLCFAGSRAAWSRQQWLDHMGRGIDIAAYLAVQDCKKYGLVPAVFGPDRYNQLAGRSGISDHRFVTRALGMGSHTDVGDGFPWDVFAQAVTKYATGQSTEEDDDMAGWENTPIPTQFVKDGNTVRPARPGEKTLTIPAWELLSWIDGRVARAEGALADIGTKLDTLLARET